MKGRLNFVYFLLYQWWVRHLLFWIFILNYFTWGFGFFPGQMTAAYIRNAKFIPGHLLVIYPLLYFLIPHFLFKKRYLLFFTGFLCLILVASAFTEQFQLNFSASNSFKGFDIKWGKNILPFVHVAAIATAIKFIKITYFQQGRTQLARQQKTMAELELLKAQIHPHFLFNTLNNLFALTLRHSPDSPNVVARLSNLLRFMIYESKQEFIPLEKEIQLLNNYIDLEKIRYGDDLDLSIEFSGDIAGKKIRPLLLLPLLENSFKHGMSQQLDQKWISLSLHMEKQNLYFKLANSKDPHEVKSAIKGKKNGIGLENVKRRLDLLYAGSHKIQITDSEGMFMVSLNIQLESEEMSNVNVKDIKGLEEGLLKQVL